MSARGVELPDGRDLVLRACSWRGPRCPHDMGSRGRARRTVRNGVCVCVSQSLEMRLASLRCCPHARRASGAASAGTCSWRGGPRGKWSPPRTACCETTSSRTVPRRRSVAARPSRRLCAGQRADAAPDEMDASASHGGYGEESGARPAHEATVPTDEDLNAFR